VRFARECSARRRKDNLGRSESNVMNQFASGVIRSRGVCTTLRRPVCCHGLPIGRHWPPSAAHVLVATLFNTPIHERFASPSPQLSPYPRQLHCAARAARQKAAYATAGGGQLSGCRLAHYDSQAHTKKLAVITPEESSACAALCPLSQRRPPRCCISRDAHWLAIEAETTAFDQDAVVLHEKKARATIHREPRL
jgi:hypothetical protein